MGAAGRRWQASTAGLLPLALCVLVACRGPDAEGDARDGVAAELGAALEGAAWAPVGPLTKGGAASAALLGDSRVLVVRAGDADLYDPDTRKFVAAGAPKGAPSLAAVVGLAGGAAMVVGGWVNGCATPPCPTATTQLFDAASGFSVAGMMSSPRARHTATVLLDGRVLVVGGIVSANQATTSTAEVGTVSAGKVAWAPVGSMSVPRWGHTATLLPGGDVLVIGGCSSEGAVVCSPTAERFSPALGTFSPAGALAKSRTLHTATALPDGSVLVVGGKDDLFSPPLARVERWLPSGAGFVAEESLPEGRVGHGAVRLGSGDVLLAGGSILTGVADVPVATALRFRVGDRRWESAGTMSTARTDAASARLASGAALVAGGKQGVAPQTPVTGADLYTELSQGGGCALDGDCVTGHCADGVCCDDACDGACRACSSAKTGVADGVCSPVRERTDPDGECDGVCFAGACLESATCDGEHTLRAPEGDVDCAAFRCPKGESACRTSCASNAQCASGKQCDEAGRCVAPASAAPQTDSSGCSSAGGHANPVPILILLLGVVGLRRRRFAIVPSLAIVAVACAPGAEPSISTSAEALGPSRWQPTPDAPQPVANPSLVALQGGSVLVTNWAVNSNGEATATVYDPVGSRFTSLGGGTHVGVGARLSSNVVLLVGVEPDKCATGIPAPHVSRAELFSPTTSTFTPLVPTKTARLAPTVTPLTDGRALIIGGTPETCSGVPASSTELFSPSGGTGGAFTPGPATHMPRSQHQATRLQDGRVLVTGGMLGGKMIADAEIFDPSPGLFAVVGKLGQARAGHCASLLPSGAVLITGGGDNSGSLSTAEVFDPATKKFSTTGAMTRRRRAHTSTVLASGHVLIAGGYDEGSSPKDLDAAELYDPATGTFSPTAPLPAARQNHDAARLEDQSVLLLGGGTLTSGPLAGGVRFVPAHQGEPCGVGGECASGFCADGLCCDARCNSTCSACAKTKTGVADGTCAPIASGTDPDEECDGVCVAGACMKTTCDGDHTLQGATTSVECRPYRCSTTTQACHGQCTSNAQCANGYVCDISSRCVAATAVSADDGGSACALGATPLGVPWWTAALALASAALRRRARRSPRSLRDAP